MPYRKVSTPSRGGTHYAIKNPFELWLGATAFASSLIYFIDPATAGEAAINQVAPGWAITWSILFLIAGILMLAGLFWASLRAEVAGLFLFATAGVLQAIAVQIRFPNASIYGFAVFLALAGAALTRAGWLISVYVQIKSHLSE